MIFLTSFLILICGQSHLNQMELFDYPFLSSFSNFIHSANVACSITGKKIWSSLSAYIWNLLPRSLLQVLPAFLAICRVYHAFLSTVDLNLSFSACKFTIHLQNVHSTYRWIHLRLITCLSLVETMQVPALIPLSASFNFQNISILGS